MNFEELITLSLKAIWGNKLRSFLTTLGIIIGVFSIIVLVSIGTGLQSYITKEVSAFGPNLIYVIPGNISSAGPVLTNRITIQDAKTLQRKLEPIAKVAPVIESASTIKYKNKQIKGAYVYGTSSTYPQTMQTIKVVKGIFFTAGHEQSGSKVAVIGNTVNDKFFKDTNAVGKKIFIGSRLYTVVGVLKKQGTMFGIDMDNIAYIPVTVAKEQFGQNIVSEIMVSANDKTLVPIVKKQIKDTLLKRLTEDDFTIETAESTLATISNVTNMLTLALGGIAAISLLVGGIGVANIMLVSVTERTREIGLRKALGAKRRDILLQFLIEAVMISVTGGVIGIALGMIVSFIIALLLVSNVTLWSVLLAFGFSVAVGIIFGMAPAIRASKLNPIDALRYE
jgi:putative ABC transport system permease protein